PGTLRSQVLEPAAGVGHARHGVLPTGLEQQDGHLGILGQPSRDHRPRRTGTADDEVVLWLETGFQLVLVETNALGEIDVGLVSWLRHVTRDRGIQGRGPMLRPRPQAPSGSPEGRARPPAGSRDRPRAPRDRRWARRTGAPFSGSRRT